MKSAVLVFPGSNREGDVAQAIELVTGRRPAMVWHGDGNFEKVDLIVVPPIREREELAHELVDPAR